MSKKPTTLDLIEQQIPSHILEQYPRFVDFLLAYYEWLTKEDNPYSKIKYHLDKLAFDQSVDEYLSMMKNEYLTDMPEEVITDKEMFIKWSRKFNLARGSHASYKLLFNMLYGDETAEIYLPKDNILKTSDGTWISGESLIQLTYSPTNQEDFQFQRIFQEIPVYGDIVRKVFADVQSVRTKYVGRYVLTELSISNIEGEFDPTFPVFTDLGVQEYIVPTVTGFDIQDAGQYYQIGQRLEIDNLDKYCVTRTIEQAGLFDTRTTSFYQVDDMIVEVNGSQIASSEYTFDGRFVSSSLFTLGSEVSVSIPAYQGYIVVDRIDELGGVLAIDVLDLPVGCAQGLNVVSTGLGVGLNATIKSGLTKSVKGYYRDNKGHLSSNMYLQDSFYYQNYSYVIKTQVDFDKYGDVVKELLHPAGFLMIGQISIVNMIELILVYVESSVRVPTVIGDDMIHKYGMGTNWKFIAWLKENRSHRVYPNTYKSTLDQDFLYGEDGYNLESIFLSQLFEYEYRPPKKGWMDKIGFSDYHVYFGQQDYSNDPESGMTYAETGYVMEEELI